jgi:hypothetical protein
MNPQVLSGPDLSTVRHLFLSEPEAEIESGVQAAAGICAGASR